MFKSINFVEIFSSFIVMAAIIDILGSIPILMNIKEQHKTIKAGQACLTALGLFLAFFFAGDALLKLFGIDAASFAVAGSSRCRPWCRRRPSVRGIRGWPSRRTG